MRRQLQAVGVALVAFYQASVAAQQTPVARVQAAATGTSTYTYAVINNSASRSIVTVTIGDDSPRGACELRALPLGWTQGSGIPGSSSTTPKGWTADAFVDEESGNVCLEFVVSESDSSSDIGPGATAKGFSVTTSEADVRYTSVHFAVIFEDGTTWSGWLEPLP